MAGWFETTGPPTPENAWTHVYRLLLWIDRTIGLAHSYESDKSQPGRPWYQRSLSFHVWVSEQLGVAPANLASEIDWLFRAVIENIVAGLSAERKAKAAIQREPYKDFDLPEPGEDAELEALVLEHLGPWMPEKPPREVLRLLTDEIQTHLGVENKRKNLVGEGFEDVIQAIIQRIPSPVPSQAITRANLHEIAGFHPPRTGEKPKKVDLAVVREDTGDRTLVSAKWSVRADREEQFATDFEAYVRLEATNRGFNHVLVTNEFDPARLLRACERRAGNTTLFTHVVHVNPAALQATYGVPLNSTMRSVLTHVEQGRLIGLSEWLHLLTQA